jgi:hypothetical protein
MCLPRRGPEELTQMGPGFFRNRRQAARGAFFPLMKIDDEVIGDDGAKAPRRIDQRRGVGRRREPEAANEQQRCERPCGTHF